MNTHFTKLFVAIIYTVVALLNSSCTTSYYLPQTQNIVPFDEKNDLHISLNGSLFNEQLGAGISYAITDNIGVSSSFMRFNTSNYGNDDKFLKDYIITNEYILYKKWENKFYTALNTGYSYADFNVGNPYYKINMHRFSTQPSVSYFAYKGIGLGLSSRFSYLNYNVNMLQNSTYNDYGRLLFHNYFFTRKKSMRNWFVIEPAATLLIHTEFVDLDIQCSIIPDLLNKGANFVSPINFSMTWSFNIGKFLLFPHDKSGKLRWSL